MCQINKPPLIIITGPTGVGKTDISINLAKEINGEIISADSIQVYKYMDIGSAKITQKEMQGIKHYLIDVLDPSEAFNVFLFKKMATKAIDEIYKKNKIPIIVGGTGFYIQSIIYDIDFNDEPDNSNEIRNKYELLARNYGNDYVHNILKSIDPESAALIHANNLKRVIRALEYYEINHEKMSTHNKIESQKNSPYNFAYFVLNRDREILYNRINQRVDKMIEEGLIYEVKKLLEMNYNSSLVSMQGLGYKEIINYLDGTYGIDEAIEIIKRDTRRFAKRQLTWFRREKDVIMLNYEDYDNKKEIMLNAILQHAKLKKII